MKKKCIKSFLLVFCTLAAALIGGCRSTGTAKEETEEKNVVYDKEENSLDLWQETLGTEKSSSVKASAIRGIRTVKEGIPVFAVSYEPRKYKNSYDCWSLSVPYESWVTVNTETMYEYFACVENLNLRAAEGEEQETGLEESSTSVFAAYYGGQSDGEAGQAEPDRGITYKIGKQTETGDYFVETNANDGIWLADKEAVDGLLNVRPYDYILEVANVISIETVSKVEIETEGKTYTIDLDGQYKMNGKNAGQEKVYGLYKELMSIFLAGEMPEKPKADKEEPMLTVTYHRNTEEAPEIVQKFYAYDKDYAWISINGFQRFLIEKADVEALIKTIKNAF